MIRQPAVAGQFYSGNKEELEKEVKRYLKSDMKPQKAIGVISPHAGYMYSGPTAGAVLSAVAVPQTCIILSPNHTGAGASAAIMDSGSWHIPTGDVPVDSDFCTKLENNCNELTADTMAHKFEHSLEVQLPFLLARQPELHIVPITLSHLNFERCEKIGKAIAKTITESGKDVLIVASSDMNHYEEHELTKRKDQLAIDRVLALDPKGLLTTCAEHRITMCGVIPATIMLVAAKELGAKEAKLISHTTSGDTSGDYGAVVGYAGILVK